MKSGPHSIDGKRVDPKKAERRDGKMFVGGVKGDTTDETISVRSYKIYAGYIFRVMFAALLVLLFVFKSVFDQW